MKAASFILLCVFALATSDEDIELQANGCPVDFTIHKIIVHDKYCNLFYSCVAGDLIEQRCPADLLFNVEEQTCDWAQNVDCAGKEILEYVPEENEDDDVSPGGNSDPSQAPAICATKDSDGVLVAHENCNQFYVCQTGVPIPLQCPESLLYNYDSGRCDWPDNVECGDRVIPEKPEEVDADQIGDSNLPIAVIDACASDKTSTILLAHENCNLFYKCWFGAPVAFKCPAGLMYNIELQQCDWPFNVECGDRPILEEVEEVEEDNNADTDEDAGNESPVNNDPSQASAICAAEKSDGVLIAHENCYQFYKCWHGLPVVLDCPNNLLYSPELQICDWPLSVDCGIRDRTVAKQ